MSLNLIAVNICIVGCKSRVSDCCLTTTRKIYSYIMVQVKKYGICYNANKMNTKIYHTIGTFPYYHKNRKIIVGTEAKSIP